MTSDHLETRRRVIAAADRLFYEHGFRAVGMATLRSSAGVSLKHLYVLFPSKEAIILAVLEHRHELWLGEVKHTVAQADSSEEKLLAVFDFLDTWIRSETFRGCVFINAFGELGAESPAVAQRAREHKHAFRHLLGQLVDQAHLPKDLTDELMLLAEGVQATAAITGETHLAQHARRAAEALVASARA